MPPDPNLLIGAATGDDAGVYRLTRHLALVQTADFFTPIVDDPFEYGQIAAANSLSDVYAMGGRPINALNLLGVPSDVLPPRVIARILRGGLEKAREAHCAVVGGHTIRFSEPFYGMAVTGLVSPKRIIANTQARAGDLLVLTKPLGTGVITTAIKMGKHSNQVARRAVQIMRHLNVAGAELGEKGLVKAGTDVTGFGLTGHLAAICRESGVAAEVCLSGVPVLSPEVFELMRRGCVPGGTRQNLKAAEETTEWSRATEEQRLLLADAQTSGGLLLCVRPQKLAAVLTTLHRVDSPCAAIIGRIVPPRDALITVLTSGEPGCA